MADKQARIRAAMVAIECGMGLREAARKFAIPRSTLYNKVAGIHPVEKKSTLELSTEEETAFSQWAVSLAQNGYVQTKKDFLLSIQVFIFNKTNSILFKSY